MKLGFSLSPHLLRGNPNNEADHKLLSRFSSPKALLAYLRESGVGSIELRYVAREEKHNCERLFQLVWEQGLQLTVHGRIEGMAHGESLAHHFPALDYALRHYRDFQEQLVVTLHAYAVADNSKTLEQLSEATVRQLRQWLKLVREEGHPFYFAVELTRRVAGKTDPGASIDTLLPLIGRLNDEHCGICWDMGHYYSNLLSNAQTVSLPIEPILQLPPTTFLERVVHTHIHGLSERCRTHFPLISPRSLPLEGYVRALQQAGYTGVFNLELELPRYSEQPGFIEASLDSISRLHEIINRSATGS